MRALTIAALFTAALCGSSFSSVGAEAKLVKLAMMHRHGARSGSSVIDGQVICDYPYCQLTNRGIDQLKAVGRYMNATYATALALPSSYNVSYITSVSTEVPRVVVSAESMLTGMYEGQEPLPFIQFGPDSSDTMMSQWNSVPSYILANRYNVALAYVNPIVNAAVPANNISYMADYLGMRDVCVTQGNSYTCVAIIYDNWNCNYTANQPVDPALTAMIPTIKPMVAEFVNYMLGYQPTTNEWSRELGSLGYEWASDLITFLKAPITANDYTIMKHYAAHDWSLTALYGAMGYVTVDNKGDGATVPMFAQTVIVELHADDTTGALSLQAKIGYPSNAPTGTVEFAPTPMRILCTSSTGTTYDGTNGCPIDDFKRYVDGTAPQSSQGLCYATREMLEAANCIDPGMPAVGSACLFYRQNCPNLACGLVEGSIADPRAGYACSSLLKADDPKYFAATVVALVAPSILAGAIVGFFGAGVVRKMLYKRSGSTDGAEQRQPMARA